jgi:hypothetical protein
MSFASVIAELLRENSFLITFNTYKSTLYPYSLLHDHKPFAIS